MTCARLTGVLALGLCLTACNQASAPSEASSSSVSCNQADMIGQFRPETDLLIANYDSKPDVDDLQAVAALGSVLKHPAYSCINYVATHGAYGIQEGDFLPAADLFTLAFGDNWLDAHADRDGTIAKLARRMRATIENGGAVWVAEAGQSDVTAEAVKLLPKGMWLDVHVVQHSYWNESQTSPDAMNTLIYNTRYHRIQDGNFPANGTPAFNTDEALHWDPLLANEAIGPIWIEAKRLSELHNPVADYVNPAVEAGGLDFSDTVEIGYILGFNDIEGVADFVDRFAR